MISETQRNGGLCQLAALLPILLAAIVYLPSTSQRPVMDYDEGYYSQVPRRMLETGDWVTPRVNGVRYLEKPPLMYWLTAASFRVLGVSELALRLPTALGAIALVGLVTLMAQRASGPRAAVISGLCAGFSAGTYLFTRETLHDIWLVLFVTLAMHAFLEWHRNPSHSMGRALLFYAALAGAVMSKSLIGVVFPVATVVVFFIFSRERPGWRALHVLPGLLLFLLLVAPWHWLAEIRNRGFLSFFFVSEQFLAFLKQSGPSVPLLTFWALVPVWFFPWTAFLPAAFAASRRPANSGERTLTRLALSWAGVVLGFFSVSARLEHYAFPALPALSLLVGVALSRIDDARAVKRAFRGLAALGVALLAAGLAGGIWFGAAGHEFRIPKAEPMRRAFDYPTDFSILADMPMEILWNLIMPAAVTIISLAIGFLAALWFETHRKRMRAVMSVAAAMMIVCGMIHWSLMICEDVVTSKKFALAVAGEARTGDHLVVVGDYESANSLNFYQPLRVEVFGGLAYALIGGLKYQNAPRVVLTQQEFKTLWRSENRVFVLVSRARLVELELRGMEMLAVLDRILVRNR